MHNSQSCAIDKCVNLVKQNPSQVKENCHHSKKSLYPFLVYPHFIPHPEASTVLIFSPQFCCLWIVVLISDFIQYVLCVTLLSLCIIVSQFNLFYYLFIILFLLLMNNIPLHKFITVYLFFPLMNIQAVSILDYY